MKRSTVFFALCVLLICMSGCVAISSRNVEGPITGSEFFDSFSMGAIIESNSGFLLESGVREIGGADVGPRGAWRQKQETITLQIEEENIPSFIDALKGGVENEIFKVGGTIEGRGGGVQSDIQSFSTRYRSDSIEGQINTWIVSGEGTNLHIIMLITES